LRVKAIKLEAERHIVLFTMHHIISDEWSMAVLVREVCLLYESFNEGKKSPLEELKIQYADYAYLQGQYLSGQVIEEHLQYWKRQLGGKLPVIDLAGDHPRPPVPTYRGAAKSMALPAELYQSLKSLSRREGVTLFMVLLAAFKALINRYTAESDIVIG